jgi:transposase
LQSEHKSAHSSFQVIEARVSRLEASPAVGRRRWSATAKERIVAEAMAPGARVSEIARLHGLSPQLLFTWRRKAVRAAGLASSPPVSGSFAAVEVVDSGGRGVIELALGDVVLRFGPDVSADRLQEIMRMVRSA